MDKNKKSSKKNGIFKMLSNTFKGMLFGNNKVELSILEEEQMQSPLRTIVSNFFSRKLSVIALVVFLSIFVFCFVYTAVNPFDKYLLDITQKNIGPGLNFLNIPKELDGNVKEIAVGSTFSVGIDNNGKMYTWGNMDPRLVESLKQNSPSQYKLKAVSAGLNHILAITEDGKAVTWAPNRFKLDTLPSRLASETNVKQVVAGYQMSAVVTEEGYLYFWGNTNFFGTFSQNTIPEDIQYNVERVDLSTDNIIILLKDGTVRVQGAETPAYNNVPEISNVIDIAATDDVMAALTQDGKIYTWGNIRYGLMDVPEMTSDLVKIVGGRSHFIALSSTGMVYSWGRDTYGQASVPSSIENGQVKIKDIFAGYFQSYAVPEQGKTQKWGLKGYLLGSDDFGRDIFTRLMAGGRLTLTVGAVAITIQVVLGVIVGGFSGFYGGKVDNILMRFAEIVGAIPFLPIAMTLSVVIGNRLTENQRVYLIMFILGILNWPGLARLVRAQILSEREKEFVLAAKATGIKERVIIFRHIIPNVITVVIVNATLGYATSLLTESSLSYLGFGVLEPNPTWGNMLTGSQSSNTIANYWWRWVFPAALLSLCTISINMIGDGLRDAIDPKSAER